jgi:hypothetical protein
MEKTKVEYKWLRKRNFWAEMRKFLKGFRVVEIRTEIADEMGAPPMLQRQAAAYIPTGRRVVRVTLVGFQRPSRKTVLEKVNPEVKNEGVDAPPPWPEESKAGSK